MSLYYNFHDDERLMNLLPVINIDVSIQQKIIQHEKKNKRQFTADDEVMNI